MNGMANPRELVGTEALVRAEHLVKLFPLDSRSAVYAVNDVSFGLLSGETLGLVGESGSGKTTVGRLLLRLLQPTSGRVWFRGEDITDWERERLRRERHDMTLVFQDPYLSLNPMLTARQMIEEPLLLGAISSAEDREERILETVGAVQLKESLLDRYPGELTASEQQRVAIARAIITHPGFVVVDEATSTLDARSRAVILDVLAQLQRELGISYLFISHDLTAVERLSHRIAIMYLGRVIEIAPTEAIMQRQFHPYSRALLSAVLYPDPNRKLEPFALRGEIPSAINPPDECPLIGRCPFASPVCKGPFPPLQQVQPGHFAACYRSSEFVPDGVPVAEKPDFDGSRGPRPISGPRDPGIV